MNAPWLPDDACTCTLYYSGIGLQARCPVHGELARRLMEEITRDRAGLHRAETGQAIETEYPAQEG